MRLSNALLAQTIDAGGDTLKVSLRGDTLLVQYGKDNQWTEGGVQTETGNPIPLGLHIWLPLVRRYEEMASGTRHIPIIHFGLPYDVAYTSQYPEYIMLRITPTPAG